MTSVASFAENINHTIEPLGIVATKVNGQNTLHSQVIQTLRNGHLFNTKKTTFIQPPLFQNYIKEATATARGADFESNIGTFKQKYGVNADAFYGLTKEILEKCNPPKS